MKLFFIIILMGYVTAADEEEQWKKFKLDKKKSYDTPEEEQRRFIIFKENLKEINEHNENYEKGLATYEMEINKFADLTLSEYRTMYKMFKSGSKVVYGENDTLPKINEINIDDNVTSEYLDWREKGAVTPVKNQGTCGACWIFSAVGVLEGFYFKKYNKLISFSEQNIVDCISHNLTCMGGWPPRVFDYVEKNGIIAEEVYQYEEEQKQCRQNKTQSIKIPFKALVHIENNESKLKEAVTNFGPVIACVYASSKWRFYRRGVWYERECSFYSNHATVLVGYGRENGLDYWLIKNSMGKDWGENGYIKIMRNKHYNYCGITATAFYVI